MSAQTAYEIYLKEFIYVNFENTIFPMSKAMFCSNYPMFVHHFKTYGKIDLYYLLGFHKSWPILERKLLNHLNGL